MLIENTANPMAATAMMGCHFMPCPYGSGYPLQPRPAGRGVRCYPSRNANRHALPQPVARKGEGRRSGASTTMGASGGTTKAPGAKDVRTTAGRMGIFDV